MSEIFHNSIKRFVSLFSEWAPIEFQYVIIVRSNTIKKNDDVKNSHRKKLYRMLSFCRFHNRRTIQKKVYVFFSMKKKVLHQCKNKKQQHKRLVNQIPEQFDITVFRLSIGMLSVQLRKSYVLLFFFYRNILDSEEIALSQNFFCWSDLLVIIVPNSIETWVKMPIIKVKRKHSEYQWFLQKSHHFVCISPNWRAEWSKIEIYLDNVLRKWSRYVK